MVETLFAVTRELFHFVFVEYFGYRQMTIPLMLPSGGKKKTILTDATAAAVGRPLYVGVPEGLLFNSPVVLFDAVVKKKKLGDILFEQKRQGRWSYVNDSEVCGWALTDTLTSNIEPVLFEIDKAYEADSREALFVRSCIGDEFNGDALKLPLQPEEYVYYRLALQGRGISWTHTRPRLAGRWHVLLKNNAHVHISIAPSEDSIMEYADGESVGHIVYVDVVLPDQSIVVSGLDADRNNVYAVTRLYKDDWQALRPVFLEVNRDNE